MVSSLDKAQDKAEANSNSKSAVSSTKPNKTAPQAHRRTVFMRLAISAVLAAIVGGAWWYYLQGREETDDAYVDAHISNISSRISGTITQVFVQDNQLVKAGQVIFKLDPRDYDIKVEQAQAALEQARHQALADKDKINESALSSQGQTTQANADVFAVQAQIEAARFAVNQTESDIKRTEMKVHEQEAQVRFAQADFERYKSVYAERVVTKQQFDKAKESYDIALAQLQQAHNSLQWEKEKQQQAKSQLDEAIRRLSKSKGGVTTALAATQQAQVDTEEYASALANLKKAEATLKQAKLESSYTTIIAPVAGRIGHKSAEVGQHIDAGQLLMAVVQPHPWITANYKETQVGKMHRGQPVEIKIDSFPGRTFHGAVDSLSPASGAKFSMLPPDNATGNFTKVVQRVPVKIFFNEKNRQDSRDIQDIQDKMAPGMSCLVTVFTKTGG